jgi:hypothetical protein
LLKPFSLARKKKIFIKVTAIAKERLKVYFLDFLMCNSKMVRGRFVSSRITDESFYNITYNGEKLLNNPFLLLKKKKSFSTIVLKMLLINCLLKKNILRALGVVKRQSLFIRVPPVPHHPTPQLQLSSTNPSSPNNKPQLPR